MKQSEGFSRIGPSAITIISMVGSVWLLALGLGTLPLGTSYVVWTGIGAVGTFAVGIAFLGESASITGVAAAGFIIIGLIMMKMSAMT